jgi:hypothetical protein
MSERQYKQVTSAGSQREAVAIVRDQHRNQHRTENGTP